MTYNHQAIYRAYTGVVTIRDDVGAFDADGNQVTLDQSVIDAAAAELSTENAWSNLRAKRTQLLAETDYLALSDATLSADMRTYRQALRDLPANTSDPANPTWPLSHERQAHHLPPNDDGGVSVIIPSDNCGLSVEDIARKDVPAGKAYQIVDRSGRSAIVRSVMWTYTES